jgi:hypothetical protein
MSDGTCPWVGNDAMKQGETCYNLQHAADNGCTSLSRPASVDDGSSTGDDGMKAFIPPLAWKFISQF